MAVSQYLDPRAVALDARHFDFRKYVQKARWSSFWHQMDEILSRKIQTVLEVGGGPGLVASLLQNRCGVQVTRVDINRNIRPDCVASVQNLPFADNSHDSACAFQVLEHLPYENALQGVREMIRVSRRWVLISLPDAKPVYRYSLSILKVLRITLFLPGRLFRNQPHVFNGSHYWELNTREHPLEKVLDDITGQNPGVRLEKTYRCPDNPYHRFIVLERLPAGRRP